MCLLHCIKSEVVYREKTYLTSLCSVHSFVKHKQLIFLFVLFVLTKVKKNLNSIDCLGYLYIISPLISNFFMVDAGVYGVFASVAWLGKFFKMAFLKKICKL